MSGPDEDQLEQVEDVVETTPPPPPAAETPSETTPVRLLGASHGAQRNAVVEVDAAKAQSLIDRGLARAVE